jgi:hypothetical protein
MVVTEEKYIDHDFNLPNHSTQLAKAEEVIEKLKDKVKILHEKKCINNKLHTDTFEEIIRILDYVGTLSKAAFDIEEDIERLYTKQYCHAPELGKKLCNDHYEKIHHPYTLLKNRCFRLLEELDEMYRKKFKKNPPNWNI